MVLQSESEQDGLCNGSTGKPNGAKWAKQMLDSIQLIPGVTLAGIAAIVK